MNIRKTFSSLVVVLCMLLSTPFAVMCATPETGAWWQNYLTPQDRAENVLVKIINTADKGILAVGYSDDGNGAYGHWGGRGSGIITKFLSDGKVAWCRGFCKPGAFDNAAFSDVVELADGSFIAAGEALQTIKDANPAWGVFAVKVGENGNVLWQKFLSPKGDKYGSYSAKIVQNDDDTVTIMGTQTHYIDGYGRSDAGFALTLDTASGSSKSPITLINAELNSPSFAKTEDGGYVVAKDYNVMGLGTLIEFEKFDSSGASVFAKVYNPKIGENPGILSRARVLVTEQGYTLVGQIQDAPLTRLGIFVLQISPTGECLGGKMLTNLDPAGQENPLAQSNSVISVETTRDGGLIISSRNSYSSVDDIVFTVDGGMGIVSSSLISNHSAGGGLTVFDVIQDTEDGYVAATSNPSLALLDDHLQLNLKGLDIKSEKTAAIKASDLSVITMDPEVNHGIRSEYLVSLDSQDVNLYDNSILYADGSRYPVKPEITVSSSSFPFGVVKVGQDSVTKTLTITNKGDGALEISSITIEGTNAGDFIIKAKTATTSLAKGTSTSVDIVLRPKSPGGKAASLVIRSDDPARSVLSINLLGEAVKPAAFTVEASPSSTDFGSLAVGTKSATKQIKVKNTGSKAIQIGNALISGSATKDFSISLKSTKMSLKPGESTTIALVFNPKSAGKKQITVSVVSAAASHEKVAVTASGVGK